MRNIINLFAVILATALFQSCQDVVDIPLDTASPRLVIEASINWQKGTDGSAQVIKLTTTTGYYANTIPPVSGATVFITNSAGNVFDFVETPNTGKYVCSDFIPELDEAYTLTVVNGGQTYTASETLKPVASINLVTQEISSGIGENGLLIKAFYEDPANQENYYLYKYKFTNSLKPQYYADKDLFFQGNAFFSLAFSSDAVAGDQVEITHYGISKAYYNYMNILLGAAGNTGGGPFQSPPANVRGNIKNTTNFDNYPLGYFRLGEIDVKNYTIQ